LHKRLAASVALALVLTVVQASSAPIALALWGVCEQFPQGQPPNQDFGYAFHGGTEWDVIGTTTGAVSRVYTKNPAICVQPNQQAGYPRGSGSWVMLATDDGRYFQVGSIKEDPYITCPRYFMSYKATPGGVPLKEFGPACTSSSTWYRFDLKKISGFWHARIIVDATNQVVWDANDEPSSLWPPDGPDLAQYASEVHNRRNDRAGGVNTTRLTFDLARWYTSSGTVVLANMQGTERFCHFCGGTGTPPYNPYNTQWYDGNTFEVWTDDF
jgi:hypothetical protein